MSIDQIVASLSEPDQAAVTEIMGRADQKIERRRQQETAIADYLARILKNPTLGRELRRLIREIANER